MAKSRFIESLEEQYTKKDAKSVLRYKAPDGKWRYVQTSKDASGGNMPSGGGMTEVTWQGLKDKRDNGELNPGSLYRITDYNCTTTQENTQSAGHQFDIVLLALSEDKLAEEGWAMMHDGVDMFNDYDIYTITFNDGISKQVYYKVIPNSGGSADTEYRLVDTETFLGNSIWRDPAQDGFVINTENKTATNAYVSSTQFESYLQTQYSYNYFQNSNLSAWKVWYSLDNDKSRFAWADDSVDEGTPASITYRTFKEFILTRNSSIDKVENGVQYYGWGTTGTNAFTKTLDIIVGETQVWNSIGTLLNKISAYNPGQEGTGLPNGRGVIYRLIDEWCNDVPYDFKNIQFYIENTDLWIYAITDDDAVAEDPTLDGIRVKAIHLLSNYNNSLSSISRSRLSRTSLINVIFLNNSNVYFDGANNTIVRDGSNALK